MVKGLFISFENLTEEEQINLWYKIRMWADSELPADKTLFIGVKK